MKNRKKRILSAVLAVMLCMTAFPLTAFAGGGPEDGEPAESIPIKETSETDDSGVTVPEPLTPEGNMTLVDDIDGEASDDKQFVTVVTQNGNYFYIIIDRADDGENTVHFLNQVDEADLMALMEDGTVTVETPATCICTDKCVAGEVNTNCPVCKTDMANCIGRSPTAEPEPEPEKNGGMGGILIIVLILALGGGGAYYYFKVVKPKQSAKGNSDLDDFDFEDDEDEETELEVFEDEQEQEK